MELCYCYKAQRLRLSADSSLALISWFPYTVMNLWEMYRVLFAYLMYLKGEEGAMDKANYTQIKIHRLKLLCQNNNNLCLCS